MIEFKEYFFSLTRHARKDFARKCGVTPEYLTMIANGQRRASGDLAICIEKHSGRKVTCEHVRPDMDWSFIRAGVKSDHSVCL